MTKKSTLTTIVAIAMIASSVVVVKHALADTTSLVQSLSWKGHRKGEIGMPGVIGTVSAISGTTLTLTATSNQAVYNVDASKAKIRTGSSTSTLDVSNVHVGDTLVVKGSVNGASVAATTIVDGPLPKKFNHTTSTAGIKFMKKHNFYQNKLSGSVQSISGNVLTVLGTSTTYTIDASKARIMDTTKKKGTISNVQINDNVTIVGRQPGSTGVIDAFVVSDISRTF